MSILAQQRRKDPRRGFAGDFIEVLKSITPALAKQPQLKIITNAGGMNPIACAQAAAEMLAKAGLSESQIGVVTGDDLLASGTGLPPVTGADSILPQNIVSANA